MKLAVLVKTVKELNIQSEVDIAKVKDLSNEILNKWRDVKKRYRDKLKTDCRFNEWFHAECEAKEEIILALFQLINSKLIGLLTHQK